MKIYETSRYLNSLSVGNGSLKFRLGEDNTRHYFSVETPTLKHNLTSLAEKI